MRRSRQAFSARSNQTLGSNPKADRHSTAFTSASSTILISASRPSVSKPHDPHSNGNKIHVTQKDPPRFLREKTAKNRGEIRQFCQGDLKSNRSQNEIESFSKCPHRRAEWSAPLAWDTENGDSSPLLGEDW